MGINICLPLCLLWLVSSCFAAKVVILPLWGPSHYLVLSKLGEELNRRGHEVSIFVYQGAHYASEEKPLVKVFQTTNTSAIIDHATGVSFTKGKSIPELIHELFWLQKIYCDSFLSDDKVLNELKATDVIVGDSVFMCSALVAAKFNIPHVTVVQSTLPGTPTLQLYGLSTYPSYVPQMFSALSPDMGLLGRVKNFLLYIGRFVISEVCSRFYSEVKTKHNIKPEESISKTLRTVDLVLLEKNLLLDYAMPLPPYVKEVGSFMPGPAKPLQPELESFMSSSGEDGVILVTFGSMVDTLDNRVVETMNEAFSKLRQKVIWRINTETFEGKLASNTKPSRWLPQNDILGHPKTKLFITHAGASGLAEAVYHGVPMICSPFFGDQFDNARSVEYIGLGETLSVRKTTVEQLVEMINKVLTEKRYKEKADYVSRVVKMRPRTPLEEAAELIEYVHAVGNLAHLKPKGLELPFYQLYMLDVLLVVGVVFAVVLFIVVAVVKRGINRICGAQTKSKTS